MVRMRTARCRGLSLVETMAAVAILTITAATVTLGGPAHFRAVAASHRQTLAAAALNDALEQARAATDLAPGSESRVLAGDLPGATLTRTVTERSPGLLEVEVAIRWREGEAFPSRLRATTLVARGAR